MPGTAGIIFALVNDHVPSHMFSFVQDSLIHVVSVGTDLLEGVADEVQDLVASRTWSRGRACTSLRLRALRQRYQCVLDAIKVHNRAYGGCQLICMPALLSESVACLYAWLVLGVLRLGEKTGDWADGSKWGGLCGIVTATKLLFLCSIGEHASWENSRISAALQSGITSQRDMDPRVKNEMEGFLHQIQMQEIRFGAFDLIYYDSRTMIGVIASVISYLVVLAQFSALLRQSRNDLL